MSRLGWVLSFCFSGLAIMGAFCVTLGISMVEHTANDRWDDNMAGWTLFYCVVFFAWVMAMAVCLLACRTLPVEASLAPISQLVKLSAGITVVTGVFLYLSRITCVALAGERPSIPFTAWAVNMWPFVTGWAVLIAIAVLRYR